MVTRIPALGGGWMICHFSNIQVHFVFCQLNFIVLFPFFIKYYHILFIIIVFRLGCDRPSGLLLIRARCTFFHTHASLLCAHVFVCLIVLFRSCCSHAQVFGKTLVHEFLISYSHTEWYFIFPTVQLQVHNENSVRCGRNTDALVNLNTKLN